MAARSLLFLLGIPLLTAGEIFSQDAYVNTQFAIYHLDGGPGNCTRTPIANEWGVDNNILSIAVFKDTMYYNTWTGELKRFKIGVPNSGQTLLSSGAQFNSMTVDKNGVLYMANEDLFRYDPRTNQLSDMGLMPFNSMGDLAFYNDRLLMAGYDPEDWSTGLFEINISNPAASSLYMSTAPFFGLLSYPVPCAKNKYYGLLSTNAGLTELVELDLESKTVIGNACTMPEDILDAASSTELGVDSKVQINSLTVDKACTSSTGLVRINASYPGSGDITYTLDNAVSNTTGVFNSVGAGQHSIRTKAPGGICSADTLFFVAAPYNIVASIVKVNPDNCANVAGSIRIDATSSAAGVTFTLLNSNSSRTTGSFTNLRGGRYDFRISDASGCSKDTSVALVENMPLGGCNDVFIANAFSPNNDGINDLFIVNLPSSFHSVQLQVFDRWGNMVCYGKGNSIHWDGTFKGQPQPIGIYVYSLVYIDPNNTQKNLRGTISLVR